MSLSDLMRKKVRGFCLGGVGMLEACGGVGLRNTWGVMVQRCMPCCFCGEAWFPAKVSRVNAWRAAELGLLRAVLS